MFDFSELPFRVRVHPDVIAGEDDLLLRIRFQQSLSKEQQTDVQDAISRWFYDRVFPAKLANYMDDDFKWYTKGTLVVVFIDTGGTEPALASYLNDLFQEVNLIVPLKEVKLSVD